MITKLTPKSIYSRLNANLDPIKFNSNEFAYFKVRALSKDILDGMLYFDLTQGDILKESADKLLDKTVYANHNTNVKEWVGKIIHTEWNSDSNPEGIDAIIKVPKPDSEYSTDFNSHVVKGLLSGALNSFSVGVKWLIRSSHPEMQPEEFLLQQGNIVNNEMVRVIIDSISDYSELSVVYEGHDKNAKLKDKIILEKDAFGLKDSIHIDNKNILSNIFTQYSQLSKDVDLYNVLNLNHGGNMESNSKNNETNNETTTSQATQQKMSSGTNTQRLDNLEKKILSLSDNVNQLTDENEQLRANEIFYKEKLQQIESEKSQLQKQLLNDSYESFKDENLREGNIVKAQLLVDSNGKEHLREFYQTLNNEQQKLFIEFVKSSPLKALTNLTSSEKSHSELKKKKTDSPASSNKEQFIAKKLRDYAKLEDKTMLDIYQDDSIYNRLYSRAERDWIDYISNQ